MFASENSATHELTSLPETERQGPDCRMQAMTVMFTDMAGSSRFAEKFGARASLQKRKRHNGLLLSLVEEHRGRLVEIVGDSLMVIFEKAADAANCAIAMQHRLSEYNASDDVDVDDLEIHIRIGMHTGKLIVYSSGSHFEVAGRAVNVAARVEAANNKQTDQILLSDATLVELQDSGSFRTDLLPAVKAKGVGKLQIHRLLWEEHTVEDSQPETPVVAAEPQPAVPLQIARPQRLSASSAVMPRRTQTPAAVLRACHSLFLDVENQQGHVLPVWVRLEPGQPHAVSSRIDCDETMRISAREAIVSAFELARRLGFEHARLDNYAVEWWVGKQEIQYEGASLGLAAAMATIAALTESQVEPRTAVTGAVAQGNVVAVSGVSCKWESLRALGTFSRLVIAPGNLADLPTAAWRERDLKIVAVPTLDAAVAEVFGKLERPSTPGERWA